MRGSQILGLLFLATSCSWQVVHGAPDADASWPGSDAGAISQADAQMAGDGGAPSDAALPRDAGPTDPYPSGVCPAAPIPNTVPPGWQRYDGFSCWCPLYIPTPLAEPVEPIRWEPCPSPVPEASGCRRMVLRDRTNTAFRTTLFPQFHSDHEGKGLLQFGRIRFDGSDLRYRLVAELDGPVRVAFLQATATNKVCELADTSLTGSQYVFHVMGVIQPDGVIGGSIWERYPDPRFIRTGLDGATHRWWVTPGWFVTDGVELVAESWDGASRVSIANAPGSIHEVTGAGAELFLEYGGHARIALWTSASGVTPFLPRPSDVSGRMNGNFATDGKDMVWLSAERDVDRPDLGTMELWTAPYTIDRLELDQTARRVAAFPCGIGPFPLSVGCGYVAAINGDGLAGPNMVVVRLRDDAKFEVGTKSPSNPGWIYLTLGIHCGADGTNPEVIVMTDDGIARFPIAPMEAAGRDGGM